MITCHPVEPYLGRSLLNVAAHGNGEGQRDDNPHGGTNLSPRAVHTLSVFQGVYGNKVATLERFKENYKTKLSDEIRQRLVLENDEVSYLQISFFTHIYGITRCVTAPTTYCRSVKSLVSLLS